MPYAERTDIDNVFGSINVDQWADLNNNQDAQEIADRVEWALETAHAKLNNRLRGGRYAIPFEAPVDPQIVNLEAQLAGLALYDSRGVGDDEDTQDTFSKLRKSLWQEVSKIRAGQIRLDVTDVATSVPQVIAENDS